MGGQTQDTETQWSSTITTRECTPGDVEPKYTLILVDYGKVKHFTYQSIARATPIRSSPPGAHFLPLRLTLLKNGSPSVSSISPQILPSEIS